jgi:membrane-bound serine protease (ClpP class)
MTRFLFLCFSFFVAFGLNAKDSSSIVSDSSSLYVVHLQDEIDAPAWRKIKIGLEEARKTKASFFLLHLNTYGGRVDFADSIRSAILAFELPTAVYIEANAASAGALISIACDSIYMGPGSTIGAASVVNQNGEVAPEKYQSFFRGKMRATAIENKRNPDIAEGMVDPKIVVEGVVDENTLITFTVQEAIDNGYCEGKFETVDALIKAKYPKLKVTQHKVSAVEKMILFLINPAVSGLLIMLVIGGIYFELQSPGVGFPIIMSAIAATLFFAPHYLHGLANYWEIILFIIGVILIAVEVFVIPGFGVAGIAGILCVISGLAFSLIGIVPTDSGLLLPDLDRLGFAFALVLSSLVIAIFSSFMLSKYLLDERNAFGRKIVLAANQKSVKYQISANKKNESYIGLKGVSKSRLMPGGKIEIDGEYYDAIAESGYIDPQTPVTVVKISNGQLVVRITTS